MVVELVVVGRVGVVFVSASNHRPPNPRLHRTRGDRRAASAGGEDCASGDGRRGAPVTRNPLGRPPPLNAGST